MKNAILLLIDRSGSMNSRENNVNKILKKIPSSINYETDLVSVWVFPSSSNENNYYSILQEFNKTDKQTLHSKLHNLPPLGGGTPLVQSLEAAIDSICNVTADTKKIILISDGGQTGAAEMIRKRFGRSLNQICETFVLYMGSSQSDANQLSNLAEVMGGKFKQINDNDSNIDIHGEDVIRLISNKEKHEAKTNSEKNRCYSSLSWIIFQFMAFLLLIYLSVSNYLTYREIITLHSNMMASDKYLQNVAVKPVNEYKQLLNAIKAQSSEKNNFKASLLELKTTIENITEVINEQKDKQSQLELLLQENNKHILGAIKTQSNEIIINENKKLKASLKELKTAINKISDNIKEQKNNDSLSELKKEHEKLIKGHEELANFISHQDEVIQKVISNIRKE